MKNPALLAACATLALAGTARAETVADRKGAILQDRASLENDPRWIYDDYERAFAEARRTASAKSLCRPVSSIRFPGRRLWAWNWRPITPPA